MSEPLGKVQASNASPATSTTQRISTSTADASTPRSELNSPQIAVEIGNAIPVVFGKRDGDVGGVWISPGATEMRLVNEVDNSVEVSYHLVLSDGEIGAVQPTDVFQGDLQRGTSLFSFDGRAATWEPGNYAVQRWAEIQYNSAEEFNSQPSQVYDGTVRSTGNHVTYFEVNHTNISSGTGITSLPNFLGTGAPTTQTRYFEPQFLETGNLTAKQSGNLTQIFRREITEIDRPPLPLPVGPVFAGSGGSYEGLSCLSYTDSFPNEDDRWKLQVHAFVREGVSVDRLDGTYGPSSLFPDLARWLMRKRLPDKLIDSSILEDAASFCSAQGIFFDGQLAAPNNLRDFLNRVAGLSLLTVTQLQGKLGLRPALPYNSSFEIYTGPSVPRVKFTEANIVSGTFAVQYVPLADRQPFVAEMLWRQQPDGNVGLVRATQVQYDDTAAELLPVEQFDLSDFCTSHLHAVKVGASILSRRRHVTHTATLSAQPGSYAGQLIPGDIVEVSLARLSSADRPTGDAVQEHHYFYQVNSVATDRQGKVDLVLTHWPVDENGASVVALDIANVDPGAVSNDPTGLPELVDPAEDFYEEEFFDNYFTTLSFTTDTSVPGFITFCVESSRPISNGDLVVRLNTGDVITVREGETIGCVTRAIDESFFNDVLGDLGDLGLDIGDFDINSLDSLTGLLDGLDDSILIGDLDDFLIEAILLDLETLDGLFDLGDLDGLIDGLSLGDLGDLGDLTIGGLEDLLAGLNIEDFQIDLNIEAISIGLDGQLDLQIDIGEVSIDVEDIDINISVDEISDNELGELDLNLDELGLDLGDLDLDLNLDLDLGNLGGQIDPEDLQTSASCATQENPDRGQILAIEVAGGDPNEYSFNQIYRLEGGNGEGARGIFLNNTTFQLTDRGRGYKIGNVLVPDVLSIIFNPALLRVTQVDLTGLEPGLSPIRPDMTVSYTDSTWDSGSGQLVLTLTLSPTGVPPHPNRCATGRGGDDQGRLPNGDCAAPGLFVTEIYDEEKSYAVNALTGVPLAEGEEGYDITYPDLGDAEHFIPPAPNGSPGTTYRSILTRIFNYSEIAPPQGVNWHIFIRTNEFFGGFCEIAATNDSEWVLEGPPARTKMFVSVIDEDNSYSEQEKEQQWQSFKNLHPSELFFLLVPGNGVTTPSGFDGQFFFVGRSGEGGSQTNWLGLLPLEEWRNPDPNNEGQFLSTTFIETCRIAVDDSGSMTRDTVEPDLNTFKSNLAAYGITVNEVSMGTSENWIGPHLN